MKKTLLFASVFAATLLCAVTLFILPASASIVQGDCGAQGDNLQWTYDTQTGILTITGEGKMMDYADCQSPWYSYVSFIEEIRIGSSVTSIGNYAFDNCRYLRSITIPSSVTRIGESAFCYCTLLKSVTIPDSVQTIDDAAFSYCTSLTEVTLSNSLTHLGGWAFYNCGELASINIPESLVSMGKKPFLNSNKVLQYENGLGYAGNWIVYANTTATSFTIRENTRGIAMEAFKSCKKIRSISLPDGLISIGEHAFEDCQNLEVIVLPHSIREVGSFAFKNCPDLAKILYHGSEEEWDAIPFRTGNGNLPSLMQFHEWDEGVVTREPTDLRRGERTYHCGCGETRVEKIPSGLEMAGFDESTLGGLAVVIVVLLILFAVATVAFLLIAAAITVIIVIAVRKQKQKKKKEIEEIFDPESEF